MGRLSGLLLLAGLSLAVGGCKEEGTVTVRSITFKGVTAVDESQLRSALATRQGSRLPWGRRFLFDRSRLDADLQPGDLVARLLPFGNISMTQARNPRCRHQQRILNVWVLPKGTGGQPLPTVSQSKPGSLVETPEQLRQVQEGLEAHARAHGGGFNGSGQKVSP